MFALRLVALLASSIVGGVLLTFSGPQAWLGGAMLAAGLVCLWVESREGNLVPEFLQRFLLWVWEGKVWSIRVLDVIAGLVIFGFCWVLLPKGLQGIPPMSHDHMVHYVKAHRLYHDLLSQGVLWGWSHDWFGGYPVNYLYPFGGDLWVVMVYILGFGKLTMAQAYSLAFWLHWLLVGWAVYAFSRRMFHPLVGLGAVVMLWIDIGSSRLGGGVFTLDFGVWPISLSVAFGLLALRQLPKVLLEDSWPAVGWFGLWMGLALLSHPIQLVHFVAMFPVSLIALYISRSTDRWFQPMFRLGLAFAVGGMLAGIWVFPFFSFKAWTQSYGLPGMDINEYSEKLLFLTYLKGTNVWMLAIGLLGLVRFLLGRKFLTVYMGLFSLLMLVFSQKTLLEVLHLPELLPSIKNIQFIRFAYLWKPFLFLGGAWLLWEGLKLIREQLLSQWLTRETNNPGRTTYNVPTVRLYLQSLVIAGLLSALLLPLLHQVKMRHFIRIQKDYKTYEKDPFYVSKLLLRNWFQKNKPKLNGFYRVAIWEHRNSHWLHDLDIKLNVPTYKVGSTPAIVFKYKTETPDSRVFRSLNVRFVVTRSRRYHRALKFRKQFHKLYLYEFRDWNPLPFSISRGTGPVRLVSMEREKIVLDAGKRASGHLHLHVSYFPRWSVTRNGIPISLNSFTYPNLDNFSIMRVKLDPGRYEFRFKRGWAEWMGAVASSLGGLFILLLFVSGPLFRRWTSASSMLRDGWETLWFLERRIQPLLHVLFIVLLVLGLPLLVALVVWRPNASEVHPKQRKLVKHVNVRFADELNFAKIHEETRRRTYSCRMKKNMWQCRVYQIHKRRPIIQTYLDSWDERECIWTDPRRHAKVVVQFQEVTVGTAIVGEYTTMGRPVSAFHNAVRVRVLLNGKLAYEGKTLKDIKTRFFHISLPPEEHHSPVRVTLEIQAVRRSRRYLCLRMFGVEETAASHTKVVPPTKVRARKKPLLPKTLRKGATQPPKLPTLRLAPVKAFPDARPAVNQGAPPKRRAFLQRVSTKKDNQPSSRAASRATSRPIPPSGSSFPETRP
ncbi:MAG: hypothetical protein EP343_10475 [Deltaproteobacteria bacterium]|nr:MAG: hypothetical protein EP343_10475 [Deltaproteobacteria bacterium]